MPIVKIESLEDSRLLQYRDVRNKSHYRTTGYFVAEGWRVVERLLSSGLTVDSILVSARREQTMAVRFADRALVYVIPDAIAEQLVGYNFHAGVLAAALKPENPPLYQLLESPSGGPAPPLIVCCPHLTGPDNLGSLTRLAAGFGASGILLGAGSVDPYLRRCVRVSMGTIFRLPIRVTDQLEEELFFLRRQHGFELLAAEACETSQSLADFARAARPQRPRVLLFGNEAEGLGADWLAQMDAILHIPMQPGVDSLNIANAAGIFLYELTRKSGQTHG